MRLPAIIVAAVVASACGGRTTPPTNGGATNPAPGGPASSAPVAVTGLERIGWDQQISGGSIRDHQFMAFVDGRRTSLPDVQCAASAGPSGHSCSAQLPYLTDGRHTIKIATSRRVQEEEPVSDRSAELVVIKGPSAVAAATDLRIPASASAAPLVPPVAADAEAFGVEIVATHLAPVNDLAALPDGRIVIAEKFGIVRIVSSGATESAAVAALDGVSPAHGGLMAIAPHPAFSRNHLLYLLYAAETDRGVFYRVSRGREVGGRLGEIAVLGDLALAQRDGSGALRFGADDKLYVALSDHAAGEPRDASYRGTLLRLEADGRTPADSAGGSPIFSSGHKRVFGLAPAPVAESWLMSEIADTGRIRLLRRGTEGAGSPADRSVLELGATAHPGALIVCSGLAFPRWRGDLLVARLDGQGITRVTLKGAATQATLLPNLAGVFGRIRSLIEGHDGSIYFGTANREAASFSGFGEDDRVLRLSPRRPPS